MSFVCLKYGFQLKQRGIYKKTQTRNSAARPKIISSWDQAWIDLASRLPRSVCVCARMHASACETGRDLGLYIPQAWHSLNQEKEGEWENKGAWLLLFCLQETDGDTWDGQTCHVHTKAGVYKLRLAEIFFKYHINKGMFKLKEKKSYNRGIHDLFLFVWATYIPSKQHKNKIKIGPRFERKVDRLVFSLARISILPESLLSAPLTKRSDIQQQAATGQGVNTFTCQPALWLTYNTCGWPQIWLESLSAVVKSTLFASSQTWVIKQKEIKGAEQCHEPCRSAFVNHCNVLWNKLGWPSVADG